MREILSIVSVAVGFISLMSAVQAEPPVSDYAIVKTGQSPHASMHAVAFDSVRWTKGFWADRYQQTHEVTLRRLWELAADPEAGHVLDNMRAAGTGEGEYAGTNWQDAWLYKWIEAAACVYKETGDAWIAARMDESIALIAGAQEKDGYIATQITAQNKPRFQDPREHEVYTMGHLLTAACIHKRATGKDTLLNIAIRCADFLCETFGPGKLEKAPGHQVIEMGLAKLYRATGNEKYLQLAKFDHDTRGPGETPYHQSHQKPVDQSEAVGHAVRASYMYCGMTDVAALAGDESYFKAAQRIWENVVTKKLYLTDFEKFYS